MICLAYSKLIPCVLQFYVWRHPACFFAKYSPSYEELKGSEDLKWEEQEALKALCPGANGDDDDDEDPTEVGWCCEYAKSGRSKCKGCFQKIDQGVLRMGRTYFDDCIGHEITSWYHPDCADLTGTVQDLSGPQRCAPCLSSIACTKITHTTWTKC